MRITTVDGPAQRPLRPQRRLRAADARRSSKAVLGQADHAPVRRPVRHAPRAAACARASRQRSSTSATSTTRAAGRTRPSPRWTASPSSSSAPSDLLVQGGSDTADQTVRDAVAAEIDQIIEGVKQEANATYGGRYVFAGTATDDAAVRLGADDTYQGNSAA